MIIEVARWRSNAYSTTTMLNGEKIVVVMPAYNAARTLRQTYEEVMAHGIVDHVIIVPTPVTMTRSRSRAHSIACKWRCIRSIWAMARIKRLVTASRLLPEQALSS